MSVISTAAFVVALFAQQQLQQENDRVGAAPANSAAIAPTMRDGLGSVFALSGYTGGVGSGGLLGGTSGGSQDLYGTGTSGGLGGMSGMVGGAGPAGLAGMGGGASAMPGGLSGGMGGKAGMRGGAGYRSPSRHGATLHGGLAAHGKGKGAASKFDLIGAPVSTVPLNGLMKGLLASGPLTPEEAKVIVHAMIAADASNVKDPHAKASLRDASRKMAAPSSSADSIALQSKMDALLPAAPDAPPRPIDGDTLQAWFGALDASNDGAISFLEWRDRTGLGLDQFRQIDTSGEGLIQFEELQRALVVSALAEGRTVDPALLDALHPETAAAAAATAAGGEPDAKTEKTEPAPKIPLDDLLKQVRSLLSKAAVQQSALASEAAAKAPAGAKGAGAKGGAKANAAPSPFDLLGTAPKAAPKKPAPKKPAPLPQYSPTGNH